MTASTPLKSHIDHLVIAAASLAEGVHWCESVLGITPEPGGEHPLMGTHNRLFTLASPAFPSTYCEIIAINSGAACARPAGSKRWFDLDDKELQLQLANSGPKLVHFVASTANLQASSRALSLQGLNRGEAIHASRMTEQGLLAWQITVREDGQRLFYGALPTLIQWGAADISSTTAPAPHPAQNMPPSGVTLQSIQASHPRPDALRIAYNAVGLGGVEVVFGPPNLMATLHTPRGMVKLESQGI